VAPDSNPRQYSTAPSIVKERGGVALSLWLTGAGEADCIIVAQHMGAIQRAAEQFRDWSRTPEATEILNSVCHGSQSAEDDMIAAFMAAFGVNALVF
jgi:hypothetical protein